MSNLAPQLALDAHEPVEHPWRESRDRFPRDTLLRSRGWEIHTRPRRGDSMWRRKRDGVVLTHALAVELVTSTRTRSKQ